MKPRVLLVDDSMTVRMDLRAALTTAGFSVTSCSTKAAAVEALKVQAFDLALLDVVLPDGSGIDLLAEIKQTPELRTIRVFMLSTADEVRVRLQGLRLGADLYVGKPYDREHLVREARQLFKMSSHSGPPTARRSWSHRKLLLVDDNPTFLKALASVLRQEGSQVVVATSGEDALALLEMERFDGILVDRIMPGLDGIETCRRLRALRSAEHIPIALMTGSIDPPTEAEALRAGADAVLLKPAQLGLLSESWRAVCEKKPPPAALREHAASLNAGAAPGAGSPLYQELVRASGLSDLMAKAVIDRALERLSIAPDLVAPEHVQRALPSIRDLLRTFLPPDEVLQRVGRMADLAGAADQPEEVRPVPVRGK